MDAHAFATTELIPDAYGGSLVPPATGYADFGPWHWFAAGIGG